MNMKLNSRWVWLPALLTSVGAGLAAPAAFAADPASDLYIGASVSSKSASSLGGGIDTALANQGLGSSTSVGNSSTNPGLRLGYRINPNFAVEATYDRAGVMNLQSSIASPAADTASGSWKANGIGLHALGILPIDSKWSVYGRLGVEQWHTSLNLASNAGGATSVSNTSSNTSLAVGAGTAYALTPNLDVTAELVRYNRVGDPANTGRVGLSDFNIGLRYHFL